MVSNASELLPEPDNPVTTISLSRGISTEMFFRLWTRAPCIAIDERAETLGLVLELIRRFSEIDKCQFLHFDVAPFRQLCGSRRFADDAAVGQIFAGRRNAGYAQITLKV